LNPELLTFVRDGDVVGCCLLVWRTLWVRGIPLRRVYLNCAGENEADSTCIEYNALLSLPDCGERVAKALASFLKKRRCDELLLSGVVDQEAIRILVDALGEYEVSETPARYVAFAPLREKHRDYLSTLSAKTRYHIRRTQRSFEEIGGACSVHLAQSVEEALGMLRQLAELHETRWKLRGAAGCFSSAKFTHFHSTLIQQHFDRAMLFRVQAGAEIVGFLYCFLYEGWVYHYQSGFCYLLDSRRSPGLLTLYYVIGDCLAREELKGFDFMAGDTEYKRSLTGDSDHKPLRWFVVRRRTVPSLLYLLLRALKRKYVKATEKGRQPVQHPSGSGPSEDVSVSTGKVVRTDSRGS
jgi:CelD/BcsL family acetyltransferase involved in cellulose biosynthesis